MSLLAFADVSAPTLPVVALEQHVAEKLHAYTGAYGPDGRESTRVKDLAVAADLLDPILRLAR